MPADLLSAREVKDYVGHNISMRRIRAALRTGELKANDLGGSIGWLTTKEHVDAWLSQMMQRVKA